MANKMRMREVSFFTERKQQRVDRRATRETEIMGRVPDEVISRKIRRDFCKARQQINRRTMVTDAKNRMLT